MKPKTKPYTVPVYRLHSEEDECADSVPVTRRMGLSAHLKEIERSDREQLVAIYLDRDASPIARKVLCIGLLTQRVVHPRHALKAALSLNAVSLLLVAARPTGHLNPTDEDDGVAVRFAQAGRLMGIPLLDYVLLVPGGGHFSYRTGRSRNLEGGHDL